MSSGPPIAPAVLAERFLELTGDIAGAIALNGTIVSVNSALARLIGAAADEIVAPRPTTSSSTPTTGPA